MKTFKILLVFILFAATQGVFAQRYGGGSSGSAVVNDSTGIPNSQVTASKIANANILRRHLAESLIDSGKIGALQVPGSKIPSSGIVNRHLAPSSIDSGKIGALQVPGSKIPSAGIVNRHYAPTSIDSGKIGALQIPGSKIPSAHILNRHLAESSIDSGKIGALQVPGSKIPNAGIVNRHYAPTSIDSGKIAALQVPGSKIPNASILNRHLAPSAVDSGKIATAQVTAIKIKNANILNQHYAPTSIDSGKIAASQVPGSKIPNANILNRHLAPSAVDSNKVSKINGNNIRTASIGATQLAPSGATAGSYTNANITITADGIVTAASNGSGGSSEYAALYRSGSIAPTMTQNSWTKVTNFTADTSPAATSNITAVADSFTIGSGGTGNYIITVGINVSNPGGAAAVIEMAIMDNQSINTEYVARMHIPASSTVFLPLSGIYVASASDDFSLVARNLSNNDDFTFGAYGYIIIEKL